MPSLNILWSKFTAWARSRFRHRLSAFFQAVSVLTGVIGGVVGLLDTFSANSTVREWVLSSGLASVAVGSLLCLAYREYRFATPIKLAQTLPQQQAASAITRDLRVFLRQKLESTTAGKPVDDEDIAKARNMLQDVLNIYSDIFSRLTSTRCRTCIKLIEIEKADINDALVFTLVRDKASAQDNATRDFDRHNKKIDKLSENSDFISLWDEKKDDTGYFMSNDLRKEREYETTSLSYRQTVENKPNRNADRGWLLPYISTIVWPIRQDSRTDLGIKKTLTIGFFTVDSQAPNVFDRDSCTPIGRILSDTLFPLLNAYTDLSAKINEIKQAESHVEA